MRIFSIICILLFGHSLLAQTSPEYNSSKILHELQKLNTVGSVLYIAAHPDDENTRLISYLTNERHFRTAYLSLTRGDGGQNLIGTEQGAALGLIRTQELLAARRTDGAEQFFSRANDFGFSKNPEETFSIWDKEEVLADVVLTIRRFKPDIIICRFPTTGEGGHGHHTASAILAEEAFVAAADPNRFPEQLREVEIWQAKRVLWNTYHFGSGINTTSSKQLQIDVGGYNPLLGKSYGQIASASRSQHKSQGFGVPMQRGEEIEFFKFIMGDKNPKKDIMEDIDVTWNRFDETKEINEVVSKLISNYDAEKPEKSLDELIDLYRKLDKIESNDVLLTHWKNYKLDACKNLIIQCAGLWMEAYPEDYSAVPGEEIKITAQALLRTNVDVKLNHVYFYHEKENSEKFFSGDVVANKKLVKNKMENIQETIVLNEDAQISNPYWLEKIHPIGMYTVDDPNLIGKPENDVLTYVVYKLNVKGLDLEIKRDLVYKSADPIKGEIYRPFEILPPATVNISSDVWVFSEKTARKVGFKIKANKKNVKGTLKVDVPEGWKIDFENADFHIKNKDGEIHIEGILTPLDNTVDGNIKAKLEIEGKIYDKSITRIEYDHIPYQFFLSESAAKLVYLDLKKGGSNIGYIPGAGDKVAENLRLIGYDVTILSNDDIAKKDLQEFDAIVTGIRAYNVNEQLHLYYDKLMDYVEKGGNLIVQYNTNNRIAPLTAEIGPYPFKITAKRVTDETAEVRFNNKDSKVLNTPNKITQADFEDWIQERGLYFAEDIDKRYETVFSMNDPKEKPLNGSLIIGKHGEGHFVYTGLAFFRELPAGVPGAYRLIVNLLGL